MTMTVARCRTAVEGVATRAIAIAGSAPVVLAAQVLGVGWLTGVVRTEGVWQPCSH